MENLTNHEKSVLQIMCVIQISDYEKLLEEEFKKSDSESRRLRIIHYSGKINELKNICSKLGVKK